MRKIGLEDQPAKPMLSVYPGGTLRDRDEGGWSRPTLACENRSLRRQREWQAWWERSCHVRYRQVMGTADIAAIVLHRQEIDRTGNAENSWKIPSMIFHVIGIRTGISIQPDAFGLE